MVERAGHHGQACAGLLVERPEPQVVAIEIVQHGSHCARKEFPSGRVLGREKVVVNAPGCPDKSVENVRGRGDDIFLEPEVAGFVSEGNASILDWIVKAGESL